MKNYDMNTVRASAIRIYDVARPEDQMMLARLQYAAHMLRVRTGRAFVIGDATGPDGRPVWTTVLMKVPSTGTFMPVLDPADQITIVTGDQADAVRTIRRVVDETIADIRRGRGQPVSAPDTTCAAIRNLDAMFRDAYGKDSVSVSYGSLEDGLFRISDRQLPDGTDQTVLVTVRSPGRDAIATVLSLGGRDRLAVTTLVTETVGILARAAGLA